jgi:sugar diacid utilization regulator
MAIDAVRPAARWTSAPAVVALRPDDPPLQLDAAPWATPVGERADLAPLQSLVDALATALGRPVVLDDGNLHLLAHSQQDDHEIDRVRLISILQRQAPPDVVRHLRRAGIERLTAPGRIAGDDAVGMRPRLCCPVRWNGMLLGYLWLVDDREPLRAHEIGQCRAAAAEVAKLLHEQEFLVHSSRRLQRRLLADLLSGSPAEVERSSLEIGRLNLMVPACRVAVLVAHAKGPAGTPLADEVRAALSAAIERCARAVPARHALAGMRDDCGVLALALAGTHDDHDLARLADRLHALLLETFARLPEWTPIVGVGPAADGLGEAGASYAHARSAARVAAAMPDHGPVARWDRLGVFRALSAIPPDHVAALADIHEGLAALVDAPTGESLLETAETYLDLGADARGAASVLHLHRSSLYYRLGKCEAVAGVNLRDGADRLAFHLALKLARLSGHLDRTGAPA